MQSESPAGPLRRGFLYPILLDSFEQGLYTTGMNIPRTIAEKGTRLFAEGRVTPIDPDQGRYQVEGDHGTYKVTVVDLEHGLGWCNCFATVIACSHLFAASAYQVAHPVQRRLKLVPADPFEGLN